MPACTLRFDLDAERDRALRAIHADDAFATLAHLREFLRGKRKHAELSDEVRAVYDELWQTFHDDLGALEELL